MGTRKSIAMQTLASIKIVLADNFAAWFLLYDKLSWNVMLTISVNDSFLMEKMITKNIFNNRSRIFLIQCDLCTKSNTYYTVNIIQLINIHLDSWMLNHVNQIKKKLTHCMTMNVIIIHDSIQTFILMYGYFFSTLHGILRFITLFVRHSQNNNQLSRTLWNNNGTEVHLTIIILYSICCDKHDTFDYIFFLYKQIRRVFQCEMDRRLNYTETNNVIWCH